MYRRPTKRQQTIRLSIIYTLMTISVLAVVGTLVLVVQGYRFDSGTGTLEQRGLIQFASTPSSATIEIDGRAIGSRTSAKTAVDPGTYEFLMWREGYETWRKTVDVEAGALVWLNYARLVPKELPVRSLASYERLDASLASPTNRSILLQPDQSRPTFQLVDISGSSISQQTVRIPSSQYTTPDEDDVEHTFTMDHWDENGRYMLIRHAYGGQYEWIVLDTRQPNETENISQVFDIPVDSALFSGTSGNILYVLSGGSLRKLDLSAGTISRPLVSDVASFRLYDTNIVTYTTVPSEDDSRQVGVYREGDTTPHVVYTTESPNTPLDAQLTTYFNTTYMVIGDNTTFGVYTGHFDGRVNGDSRLLVSRTTNEPISRVEFSLGRSHAFVRSGSDFYSYSIERDTVSHASLEEGAATSLRWLDEMNLWSSVDGSLVMQELDGANKHVINPIASGHAATLSRNGTYLYSIGTTDNGYQLQRVQMIL